MVENRNSDYREDRCLENPPLLDAQATGNDKMRVSGRRKVGGVLFGIFYGGSVSNGVEEGVEYVLKTQPYFLAQHPFLHSVVGLASSLLAGFLGAYCGQSPASGYIATAVVAALFLAANWISSGAFSILSVASAVCGVVGGCLLANLACRIPIPPEDIGSGRVFGVNWKHWLWLFIPWQLMIADAVWVAYPPSLLVGGSPTWLTISFEILRAPISVLMIGYGVMKAVQSLRADVPFSRGQSALRFLGWFVVFPILVNLLRLVGL